MSKILYELSEYLTSHQDQVIEKWENASKLDGTIGTVARRLSHSEFIDNIPAALSDLKTLIAKHGRGDAENAGDSVSEHGHHRWKQGFSLRELIRDWGVLNRILTNTLMDFFVQHHPGAHKEQKTALDILAQFVTEATSCSVRRFDELRQAEASGLAHTLEETNKKFDQTTQARGRLLREAAHDIRGNLSAIAGASSVLKIANTQKANISLEDVLDALDRGIVAVKDMLNALLDLSRLEAGEEKLELLTVDINEVIQNLTDEHRASATAKNLHLRYLSDDGLIVQTDPNKVRRITQNLMTNALQYTREGEIVVKLTSNENSWQLIVQDTGPGIQDVAGSAVAREMDDPSSKPEDKRGIQSFAYAGEGVGLSIVKRLCEILDAGISVSSVMGEGTVFTVEFPLSYES